jgi:hypothetical protein
MKSGSDYKLHFSSTGPNWVNSFGWESDVVQLATGQWYGFAFTHDATSARFFLNGQLVGTTTGTTILPYQTTIVGERLGGGDNYWKGDINTALVYKRGLSNAEILQNYNALKSRFGL